MLFFVLGSCAVALTFAAVNYLMAKKRLVDQQINQIIEQKLGTHKDELTTEILDLQEENGVLRNLLMDIAENEASANVVNEMPEEMTTRLLSTRSMRRRELVAEVEAVLKANYATDASM